MPPGLPRREEATVAAGHSPPTEQFQRLHRSARKRKEVPRVGGREASGSSLLEGRRSGLKRPSLSIQAGKARRRKKASRRPVPSQALPTAARKGIPARPRRAGGNPILERPGLAALGREGRTLPPPLDRASVRFGQKPALHFFREQHFARSSC